MPVKSLDIGWTVRRRKLLSCLGLLIHVTEQHRSMKSEEAKVTLKATSASVERIIIATGNDGQRRTFIETAARYRITANNCAINAHFNFVRDKQTNSMRQLSQRIHRFLLLSFTCSDKKTRRVNCV